jgi:hypothetical protein
MLDTKLLISLSTFVLILNSALANPVWQSETVKVASPASGEIEVHKAIRSDSKITMLVLLGGPWRIDEVDAETGLPKGSNFLLAMLPKVMSEQPVNIVVMKKPDAAGDIWNASSRVTEKHQLDLKVIFAEAERLGKPVWLVGTSLGSISAMNLYFSDLKDRVSGIALSSYKLEEVTVPVYLVGHEKDECFSSAPETLNMMSSRLTLSRNLKVQLETAGHSATGNPCGPTHWHGFVNATDEVAKRMVEWMLAVQ